MSGWPYVAAGFAIPLLWTATMIAISRGELAHAVAIFVAMVGVTGCAVRLPREDDE